MAHIPVLKKEVLEYLRPKSNKNFIDCTVNGGGHSLAILEKTGPEGKILGIDADPEVLKNTKYKIQDTKYKDRLILAHGNFADVKKIAENNNFNNISGILFDLGMSSWHVDESCRGFTFKKEEALDMRYNKEFGISAAEIINTFSENELEKIFKEYGEEKFFKKIAQKIVEARRIRRIETTLDLVKIVGGFDRKIHSATRVFQALRIAANDELGNIQKALPMTLEILKPGARIVVISFHSLEDRIIKKFFQEKSKQGILKILTKKPLTPEFAEIKVNFRARSAKLRAAEII